MVSQPIDTRVTFSFRYHELIIFSKARTSYVWGHRYELYRYIISTYLLDTHSDNVIWEEIPHKVSEHIGCRGLKPWINGLIISSIFHNTRTLRSQRENTICIIGRWEVQRGLKPCLYNFMGCVRCNFPDQLTWFYDGRQSCSDSRTENVESNDVAEC